MTIGILLAGGHSSRFAHGDKALYFDKKHQKTWTELAYNKLYQLCDEVFISANPSNFTEIQRLVPEAKIVLDQEPFMDQGPLSGLFALSNLTKQTDFLILSVDFPDLKLNSLEKLLAQENSYVRDNFTIAHLNFQAAEIENFLKSGRRRMKDFLTELGARPIELPADEIENRNIS